MLHSADRSSFVDGEPLLDFGGPRFGLIVGRNVGNAVVRHRVARRLRQICVGVTSSVPVEYDIVIRALPGAAVASSAELAAQVHSGMRKFAPDVGRS